MKIIWSPLAINKASEIADYIAQDKPSAAKRWINEVFTKVEQLKSFGVLHIIILIILYPRMDSYPDLNLSFHHIAGIAFSDI